MNATSTAAGTLRAQKNNLNGYWNPLKPELEHLPTFFPQCNDRVFFFPI